MKKIIALSSAAVLMRSLAGCGSGKVDNTTKWDYKTGLATYTRAGTSYGTASTDSDKVTSTIVAAVFDKDGKIVKISIDEVESRPGASGEIVSKKEMKDNYGMKAASGIGKEWYQQVNDLEKWLEGKDVARLTSTAGAKMKEYTRNNQRPSAAADEYPVRNSDGTINGTVPGGVMDDAAPYSNNGTTAGNIAEDVKDGVNNAIDNMTDGGRNESGTTAGMWMNEDLRAMVTIDTTNIRTAVEKAWRNAK